MRVVYHSDFLKSAASLPHNTQHKLDFLIGLLAKNPFHPLLHAKLLMGSLEKRYSFRITRDWRVVFIFIDKETIKLVKVGHRKEIYR